MTYKFCDPNTRVPVDDVASGEMKSTVGPASRGRQLQIPDEVVKALQGQDEHDGVWREAGAPLPPHK